MAAISMSIYRFTSIMFVTICPGGMNELSEYLRYGEIFARFLHISLFPLQSFSIFFLTFFSGGAWCGISYPPFFLSMAHMYDCVCISHNNIYDLSLRCHCAICLCKFRFTCTNLRITRTMHMFLLTFVLEFRWKKN